MLVLLGLLLSAAAVNAEAWVMPNKGGGKITLTKEACPFDNYKYTALKKAYTWTNEVHVVWVDADGSGERRVYDLNSFTQVK